MRTALLLAPTNPEPGYSPPTSAEELRRHLAPLAGRLLPVRDHLPLAQVLRAALQLEPDADNSTVLLCVGPHLRLDAGTAHELGLDLQFETADQETTETVEQTLADAYEHASREDYAAARQRYANADALLGNEASARHALVLVSLGELERQLGRTREARALLDRALAIAPDHIGALRGRVALAREGGESVVAAALLHRLIPHLDEETERLDALAAVASESLRAARLALEQALTLRPGDRGLLERLRAVHEAASDWTAATNVAVQIAEGIQDAPARARALVEAARLASERAENRARAVALYEAAIADDPGVPGAFAAIEAEFSRADDHLGVARAYERQLERLGQTDTIARAALLHRLAHIHRDKLEDPQAAIQALDRLILQRPDDANARIELADLLERTEQVALATRVLETAAELQPDRADTYRSLLRLFVRAGDADRAYNVSSVLIALGEADIDEQLRYSQYAPESLPAMSVGFDDDIWEQLDPPGQPHAVHELMVAIEPAALAAWFEAHEPRVRISVPPAASRQDPTRTTIQAVKTFHWASRTLGIPEPVIYATPENPRLTVATLPTVAPAIVLGRAALTGRSLSELAFMAGHHLAFSRPGGRLLAFYPDLTALRALAQATAALCRDELAVGLDAETRILRDRLARHLDPAHQARAAAAVDALLAMDRVDVSAWLRSLETLACRVALLLSGDVTVAASVLAITGAPPDGRSARERALHLLPFAISQSHTALRHLLGTAIGRG